MVLKSQHIIKSMNWQIKHSLATMNSVGLNTCIEEPIQCKICEISIHLFIQLYNHFLQMVSGWDAPWVVSQSITGLKERDK